MYCNSSSGIGSNGGISGDSEGEGDAAAAAEIRARAVARRSLMESGAVDFVVAGGGEELLLLGDSD